MQDQERRKKLPKWELVLWVYYSLTRHFDVVMILWLLQKSRLEIGSHTPASKIVPTATRPAGQVIWKSTCPAAKSTCPAFLYDNFFSQLTKYGEMRCCLHVVFSGYHLPRRTSMTEKNHRFFEWIFEAWY